MVNWYSFKDDQPVGFELVGYLSYWLNELDKDDAAKQIDKHYQHRGGFRHFDGFTMDKNRTLHYKGDPPMRPVAWTQVRDEYVLFYPHAWVAVVQKDDSFKIARID
jgi:hypothetical protein